MNYWLVKAEPDEYAWEDLIEDGTVGWTGIRNFQARNNLKAMKKNDKVLFYHAKVGLCVVGIAKVVAEHYPEPGTKEEDDWVAVDLSPVRPLKTPVTIARIKTEPILRNIPLVRNARLGVMPLDKKAFDRIVNMGR